jgi:Glycosyl hydrolase catalytic core
LLKGCALGWILSNDGTQVLFGQHDIGALAAAGATVVRFELRLGTRIRWDSTLIGNYTTVIDQMAVAGLQMIGLLGPRIVYGATQTQWNANAVETGGSGWNSFLANYVSAARQLVATFPQIGAWEIWNEPNAWTSHPSATVYTGGSFIYPSLLASTLQRVYPDVPAAVPVINGGLLAHDNNGPNLESSGVPYLSAVYNALAGARAFDAIGMHYYLDQGGVGLDPEHLQRYLNFLQKTMVEHDDARAPLPVYVTECGWQQPGCPLDLQAQNVASALHVLRNNNFVQVAANFELRDQPAANTYYGLYRSDWTPKPARDTFAYG